MRPEMLVAAAFAALIPQLTVAGSISLSAGSVKTGEVVLISVAGTDASKIEFGKKTLPLFPYGDGTMKCFAGVPIEGSGSITVSCGGDKTKLNVLPGAALRAEKLNIPAKENVDEAKAAAEHEIMLKAIATISKRKLWAGKFRVPVPGAVRAPFGVGRLVNGRSGGGHRGVDLAGDTGEPVMSAASGKVIYCERTIASGNSVVVDHGQGVVSVYFHLNGFCVKSGENVEKGRVLGYVGSTGFSTGPHLHWGVYVFGVCVDPFVFVKKDFFLKYGKH